jgi:sterol carrier protein 2
MALRNRVFVVGVGMTKFEKPGSREWDYPEMAKEAVVGALTDASIPYSAIQQACVGYCFGDSTCGQRSLYGVGLTGIPIYNVNNNCATGSTALYMAKQFIEGGLCDCVLALGFEKMEKGSLGSKFEDRTNPMDKHVMMMIEKRGMAKAPMTPQMFGNAALEHMERYGTKPEHFAKIAEKNHRHSVKNPRSQFRDDYTLEQVLKSPKVFGPLTKLQCCPTSDGAAAAVLCSERFIYKYGLQRSAVEIVGMAMATDLETTFTEQSMIKMVGYDMSKMAAQRAFQQSGMNPQDVQVIELHDCFSANELITYEALGLCPEGKAGELVERGDNTYGGKWVVNPSGGLISKGHPLGATGLAQCAELCWQLRNMAGDRQVKGAKAALQHNLGLGGAAVVTVYRLPNFNSTQNPAADAPRIESLGQAPKAVPETASAAVPAAQPAVSDKPAAAKSSSGAAGSFKAEGVFSELKKRINAELVKQVGVVYKFDIAGAGGNRSWVVDLKNGAGSLKEGDGTADCTISIKDDDFVALMGGKLNPQSAFMQGKLKIKGNMMLAQKLGALVGKKSNL